MNTNPTVASRRSPVTRLAAFGACAVLAACGTSQNYNNHDEYVPVGGNVSGLTGTVTLLNTIKQTGKNGKTSTGIDTLGVTANGPFTFGLQLAYGSTYAVTVKTQPQGQVCTVTGGTGTANANVSSIVVTCKSDVTIGGHDHGPRGRHGRAAAEWRQPARHGLERSLHLHRTGPGWLGLRRPRPGPAGGTSLQHRELHGRRDRQRDQRRRGVQGLRGPATARHLLDRPVRQLQRVSGGRPSPSARSRAMQTSCRTWPCSTLPASTCCDCSGPTTRRRRSSGSRHSTTPRCGSSRGSPCRNQPGECRVVHGRLRRFQRRAGCEGHRARQHLPERRDRQRRQRNLVLLEVHADDLPHELHHARPQQRDAARHGRRRLDLLRGPDGGRRGSCRGKARHRPADDRFRLDPQLRDPERQLLELEADRCPGRPGAGATR